MKTTHVPCKGCHSMIEVPLPDPVKEMVKEPCRCGMTETARINRYWTTALPAIVFLIATAIVTGTYLSGLTEASSAREAAERYKADLTKAREEADQYRREVDRYKTVLGELKASAQPATLEKFKPVEKTQ